MEINNYKIIKRSKLKVSSDKSWQKSVNEISGESGSGNSRAFISQNYLMNFCESCPDESMKVEKTVVQFPFKDISPRMCCGPCINGQVERRSEFFSTALTLRQNKLECFHLRLSEYEK